MRRFPASVLAALLVLPLTAPAPAAKEEKPKKKPVTREKPDPNAMAGAAGHQWADWVEPDFPFFSSVLDARDVGENFPKDNLTPRGLILNLGHNLWACFDTDLLRIACIWQGEEGKPPVTPAALAPGSYHIAGQKTKDGQDDLPKPQGKVWLANGLYPGWQAGDHPAFMDPREPGPDKEEAGRGPLDGKQGRILAVRLAGRAIVIESEFGGSLVRQAISVSGGTEKALTVSLNTWFEVTPQGSRWILGLPPADIRQAAPEFARENWNKILVPSGHAIVKLSGNPAVGTKTEPLRDGSGAITTRTRMALARSVELVFATTNAGKGLLPPTPEKPDFMRDAVLQREPSAIRQVRRWPQTVTTKATLSKKDDAYVVDDIPLPLDNPWKRNVRLADIAFLDDQGNAAAVTMDGDVWLLSGLNGDLNEVKWRRFASGLHEPMSIVARSSKSEGRSAESDVTKSTHSGIRTPNSELFVFDRNGIWRLVDTNHDGECDVYEMFCNRFAQTAETREFPNSMKLAPDGSFVLSKGGQQGTTLGKDNGKALRVSADGKTVTTLGYGLRQPFVGVHPKTGLVVASDQEGNYVPTTPIHIIKDHQFYGHLATIQPHEQYPQTIADPLTWIPHSVVPSGATLTWLTDAKMGPANDELILVSYNKPELHRVIPGSAGILAGSHSQTPTGMSALPAKPQAAVVPWIKNLDFPTLNAHVNPADGQLYAVGFQIWGTTVRRISGFARIRYTGKPRILLTGLTPCDQGVLLRFNEPLDKAAATHPDNYNVERWNYKRTFNYGSPHLKADGTPGQEWMVPSSAYLSKDGKSVFVGLPDMKTTYMQMRLGYGLKGKEGLPAQNNAYFTPYELAKFDPEKEGFDPLTVDLTPRKLVAAAQAKPTLEEGKRLYEMMGCIACHSIDGTVYGKVGPSWKGLYGSERILAKGGDKATADEAYLKESIQNPPAKVVKGYEKLDAGMPVYAGVLNDAQIESLILFIKSLK